MDGEKTVNFLVAPVQSIGVQATKVVSNGTVTVIEAPIADKGIAAEMYPGRIRWNGLVIGQDGQEFFAQFVLSGMYSLASIGFLLLLKPIKKS